MKKILCLCLFTGIAVSGQSCYYDKEEELYPATAQCETSNVTFSGHVRPLVQGNCSTSGCHIPGGSGNGIFTNYAGLKAKVDNGTVRQRVLVQKDMPPSHQLTDCQRSQLETWLNSGAPNN